MSSGTAGKKKVQFICFFLSVAHDFGVIAVRIVAKSKVMIDLFSYKSSMIFSSYIYSINDFG